MPDVLLPVAVEIDRVFVKLGRQELGQPHGSSPGAAHVRELYVALVQHLEGIEQLLPEHVLAAPIIGLGRQHGDGILRQLVGSEGRLASPDREQHISRHPELLLNGSQRAAVLGCKLLRLFRQMSDVALLDVIGGGLHEFRLPAGRGALPAGKIEVGKREIGLDALRRRLEGPARDPERLGIRPQTLQPALKNGIGCLGRGEYSEGDEQAQADPCRTAQ